MNVLNIVNRLSPGGIELLLLHAIPYLKRVGIHTDICCLGPKSTLDSRFEAQGCRILRIPKTANCYASAKYLQPILSSGDYSLVHSNFGYTSGGIALGAARENVPLAISIHSCEPLALDRWRKKPFLNSIRTQWLRWHRRLMDRHAGLFLGHSRTNLAAFAKNSEADARYRVLLNAIEPPSQPLDNALDARQATSLSDSATIVLHIGSFRREKNHTGLLSIFQRILEKEPNAELILVGDGPLREQIAEQSRSMKLARKVTFAGMQSNVWPYLAAADVFLFPSTTEGFGNALVESSYAMVPIVASDIPAHRESVAPAQHRFLFPVADHKKAADLVLQQIGAAREKDNYWVEESAAYARKHFSMKRYTEELTHFYQELVGNAA